MFEHGTIKFPAAGIVRASSALGWNGIAAEIRAHPAGELPPFTSSQLELTLALCGTGEARVARSGDGVMQDTRVRPGALWLCPIGVAEHGVRITEPLSKILHIYLPQTLLEAVSEHRADLGADHASINYAAGVEDDLLRQMGYAVLQELEAESSGGKLLVETLALGMAARLVNNHSSATDRNDERLDRLDGARLRRVLDYIEDNEHRGLSVAELAAVACLSPFHFARAFKEATGAPPHRYLSLYRLACAKQQLAETDRPLAEIALDCSFSSQANFTRAFRRAMGVTPGDFRRAARPSRH